LNVVRAIYFGNYFYGLCAVVLAIETAFQLNIVLNSFLFYLLLFLGTTVYYSYAYLGVAISGNIRSQWYKDNTISIRRLNQAYLIFCGCIGIYIVCQHWYSILNLSLLSWSLALMGPIVSLFYYGLVSFGGLKFNLRKIGWLKPFTIGFVWACAVTIYPVLFQEIQTSHHYNYSFVWLLFFIKNFMFVSLTCIMFDIKDFAADYNQKLQTLVVKIGLRKTIYRVIIPLAIVGLFSFLVFAILRGLPWTSIFINIIPFVCLIGVAFSLHQRRSILYYLMVIDGLLLLKGICGIAGALWFFDRFLISQ